MTWMTSVLQWVVGAGGNTLAFQTHRRRVLQQVLEPYLHTGQPNMLLLDLVYVRMCIWNVCIYVLYKPILRSSVAILALAFLWIKLFHPVVIVGTLVFA